MDPRYDRILLENVDYWRNSESDIEWDGDGIEDCPLETLKDMMRLIRFLGPEMEFRKWISMGAVFRGRMGGNRKFVYSGDFPASAGDLMLGLFWNMAERGGVDIETKNGSFPFSSLEEMSIRLDLLGVE